MRVLADTRHLEAEPGKTVTLTLEVVNTDDVIDGVSAHVVGLPAEYVSAVPAMLPLFPDTAGKVTLGLAVPLSHPAGRHPLMVEVISHGTDNPARYLDVDLDVTARPGLRLESRPRVMRARRGARYVLELTNTGNVPLDVAMDGVDPDRNVQTTFAPERRRVEPGGTAPILMSARGPRMFTGAEVDRTIVIAARATPVGGVPSDARGDLARVDEDAATDLFPAIVGSPRPVPQPRSIGEEDTSAAVFTSYFELERDVTVLLRQRPLISRGLLTILILLSIIAVWAAIFLLGLGKVFASDPMTKQAPASFFASLNTAASNGGGGGNGSGQGSGGDSATPAGALSKTGQLAPGMGGEIVGRVVAVNNQQPVGRILVQAYRSGPKGLVEMSSAASQTDGTYALAGLFPTAYYIKFSAKGYKTQWYPNAPDQAKGQKVTSIAQGSTSGINAAVVGLPASISGRVNAGDTLTKVTTTVTARPLVGRQTGQAVATTKTTGSGTYTLPKLAAPSTYELTFTTKGYQSSTLVDGVAGGDQRLEPTVLLGASTGQISGMVSDNGSPLGNATVTTTVNGAPLTVLTPTTGQVGAYVLGNLSTPATYVVTISSPGHGAVTRIIDLAAGKTRSGMDVALSNGTGAIAGKVIGSDGSGLGDATVTVGGAVTGSGRAPTATTLTAGSPGSFTINDLATPGDYTLTVSLAGYAPESVPVHLAANAGSSPVTIRVATKLGKITGTVLGPQGQPFSGATVTAANGQQSRTTTSATSDGSYLFDNLAPGSYSVTVTSPGLRQQTALLDVSARKTTRQNLRVG